jgi:hypothetical protein
VITEEKKYLFNYGKIYWEFKYDEILEFLDQLSPDKANIFIGG